MKRVNNSVVLFLTVLVFIQFFSLTCCADKHEEVCFDVSSVELQEDSTTAAVVISIVNNPGFASADIHIECELPIQEINSDVFNIFYSVKTGNINWSSTKNSEITGEIIEIIFIIPEGSSQGDSWGVQLQVTEIIDEETNSVPYTTKNGKVSIMQPNSGDVDTHEPIDEPISKPTLFERLISFFVRIRAFIKRVLKIGV